MKKLFAILLASIMVLSLVPASIFAVEPVKCPGDETHTLANCDSTFVKTVPAKCNNKWGYDVYKCNHCDAEFLANFVQGGTNVEHDYKLVSSTEVDCSKEQNAVEYYECTVCGDTKSEIIEKFAHDWVVISDSGYGCVNYVLEECSVCGATQEKAAGKHVWEDKPHHIVDEPGLEGDQNVEGINGLAEYKCSKCDDTKRVVIIFEHDHDYELIVEAKEPTCLEKGIKDVYRCTLCDALFECVKEADGDEPAEYEARESIKDFEIAEIAHDFSVKSENHPCEYVCAYGCGTTHYVHVHKKVAENDATCTTYGFEVWGCVHCSEIAIVEDESEPPKGHVHKTFKVEANCQNAGFEIEYCDSQYHSERFDGAKEYIEGLGEVYVHSRTDFNVNLKNHADPERIIIKYATCIAAGLYIEHCNACGYTSEPTSEGYDALGHLYYDKNGEPIEYNIDSEASCTSEGQMTVYCTRVIEFVDGEGNTHYAPCYAHETVTIPMEDHDTYLAYESHDCASYENGCYEYTLEKCNNCDYEKETKVVKPVSDLPSIFETIEDANEVHKYYAFDHETGRGYGADPRFVAGTLYKAPTCTEDGYQTFYCLNCGAGFFVTIPATGHDGDLIPGMDPVCGLFQDGIKDSYECEACGVIYTEDEDGVQTEVKDEDELVIPYKHKLTHHKQQDPTCVDDGIAEYWTCDICGLFFADANADPMSSSSALLPLMRTLWIPALDHKEVVIAQIDPTCGEDGVEGYTYCERCGEVLVNAAKVTVLKDKKGNITGYEPDEIPMLKHKNGYAIHLKDHNSNTCGVFCNSYHHDVDCTECLYKHYECSLCGYEYIDTYSPNTNGHINSKGETLKDICTNIVEGDRVCVICGQEIGASHNISTTYSDATCFEYAYTFRYCTNEGCGFDELVRDYAHPPVDHKYVVDYEESYDSDYVNEGLVYEKCYWYDGVNCKAVQTTTIPAKSGVQYFINAAEGPYCVGNTITVTVSADSFWVSVWGFNYQVAYEESVKLVGVEFLGETFVEAFEYHDDVENGIVTLASNAKNYTAIKGGVDLVKLTFQVVDPTAGSATFVVSNKDIVAQEDSDEDGVFENEEDAEGDSITVEIDKFLDVDGNGVAATMDDAFYLYNIFTGKVEGVVYTACGDADFDGDCDIDDLFILYNVIVGNQTIADIVKAQLEK